MSLLVNPQHNESGALSSGRSSQQEPTVGDDGMPRWKTLCEQAAEEQDSNKLLVLIRKINQLLAEEEKQSETPPDRMNVNDRLR
jgi:hypothetical protein